MTRPQKAPSRVAWKARPHDSTLSPTILTKTHCYDTETPEARRPVIIFTQGKILVSDETMSTSGMNHFSSTARGFSRLIIKMGRDPPWMLFIRNGIDWMLRNKGQSCRNGRRFWLGEEFFLSEGIWMLGSGVDMQIYFASMIARPNLEDSKREIYGCKRYL